jgi:hypothetical protein
MSQWHGMLANHLWSVAGESSRAYVNATFPQPFVTYTTKTFTTLASTWGLHFAMILLFPK